MLALSKAIYCFSSLSRKLDAGWPRIEHFQLQWHSCVNNVQHCFVIYTLGWGTVNKTATLLPTFDISLVFSSQPKTIGMHVGQGVKGHMFWACTTIDAGRKEWVVRNNDYLEEPNCSTNGRPGSIIILQKTFQHEPSVFPLAHLSGFKCAAFGSGWVHSFWVHFLWEFPGCWNVLARKVYICIVIVPGRCAVETTELWQILPVLAHLGTVHWKHTIIGWILCC